jgi:predicted aldo/keto reductase-like oxidoreductase
MAEDIAGPRHRFRFIQLPFNLAMHEAFSKRNQEDRQSTLQAAAVRGISVIGSATILQGRLAQGLPEELAAKLGDFSTDAQRAIQFSRSTPGLLSSLVGMSKAAHVRENLAVAGVAPLKEKDYYAIFGR